MIATQRFGGTGHQSSRTIFGAAALANVTQEQADRTLELLLRHGINHIDTAASYGDSELRVGPWMAAHRADFFLATKTAERTRQAARDELYRSLERLRVEQVDLIQLHNLVDPDEWEVAFGPGGALEAAIEAREAGLVRFIGVTGHGLTVAAMHRRSLEQFAFDSVLLPYNYAMMQNPEYAADFESLQELCREREVAVQTIKSVARGSWGEKDRSRATWYEPLEQRPEVESAVHYVLSRPGIFLNTAGDIDLLPGILEAAEVFREADGGVEEVEKHLAEMALTPLFVE